jgi:hypothetical protein
MFMEQYEAMITATHGVTKEVKTDILRGDCLEVLSDFPDNYFDLIVTSPPYADSRMDTYGGIKPDKYVEWFFQRSEQFLRVLKPTGTFILNNKVGFGQKSIFGIRGIVILVNGLIVFAMLGKGVCNLIKPKIFICTRKMSWCLWGLGRKQGLRVWGRMMLFDLIQR